MNPSARSAGLVIKDVRGVLGRAKHGSLRLSLVGLVLAASWITTPTEARPVEGRIVAIADIHGAYDELVALLREAELIDGNNSWIGGQATLVQTGDILDRGAGVRQVMALLQQLQVEAKAAGGEVVVLLGNHEAMNLLGFFNDVGAEAFLTFATEESAQRQVTETKRFGKWLRQRARRKKERAPPFGAAQKAEFAKDFPLGFYEYREAMRPDGEYGAWLRSLPMIAQRQGIVFLHGGISPSYVGRAIDELNQRMREEIALLDGCRDQLLRDGIIFVTSDPNEMVIEGLAEIEALTAQLEKAPAEARQPLRAALNRLEACVGYQDWFLVKGESPVWYRGYAKLEDAEAQEVVDQVLDALGAQRLVVGHTPQSSKRVTRRLDGRVFLLDTGMLTKVYEGRPAALEFVGDRVTAIYLDERVVLEDGPAVEPTASARLEPPAAQGLGAGVIDQLASQLALGFGVTRWAGSSGHQGLEYVDAEGQPLPFESEDQLLAFLMRGTVEFGIQTEIGVNRPRRVKVSADGITVDAVFRTVDKMERRARTKEGRRLPFLRDTYRYEPAAYQVNRLLGLGRVPAAVLRTVDGKRGSLQVWMHGMIDEQKRLELGIKAADATHWRQQIAEQKLFDRLIANVDRNQGNLLMDRKASKVWLIDHTRSFAEISTPEGLQRTTRCRRTVFEGLVGTSEEELRAAMDPYLLEGEINTLVKRWQKVTTRLQDLVEEHGEDVIIY